MDMFPKISYVNFSVALKRLEILADSRCYFPAVRNVRATKAYKLILFALENHLRIIRPCSTSGHGRFTHNLDYTATVCAFLSEMGVYYILSNDAPRGGRCGNYIQLYVCE